MGTYAAAIQPRRTAPYATLVEIAPAGADVILVRADLKDWNRAELLAAYTWGPYEGGPLDEIEGAADSSLHTALTIGAFLSRYSGTTGFVRAEGSLMTYRIVLLRPCWEF
ncbi:hypothetical protein [Streptomyces microflavus]|uniref:hypothetical protein n=1 Tax=Streptomyces microflavus TaxID=1919 RepID=UPI00365E48E4